MMKWWLSRGGKVEGPFPEEHVAHWLKFKQISLHIMACPEGGQEWKRLDETDAFTGYIPAPTPGGTRPPPPAPDTVAVRSSTTAGAARRTQARFGVLFAAIALGGATLFFELLLIGDTGEELSSGMLIETCVALGSLITWAVFHYGLWQLVPDQYRETTPGKAVGFLFIPLFNCYWVFRSYLGVNRGLNRMADDHSLPPPRANLGLATAAAVFFVLTVFFVLLHLGLPTLDGIENQYVIRDQLDLQNAYNDVLAAHLGFDILEFLCCSIPGFIVWLLMTLNQKRMVEHLLANDVPVNPASGLLACHI
jgi:hypothetical protein